MTPLYAKSRRLANYLLPLERLMELLLRMDGTEVFRVLNIPSDARICGASVDADSHSLKLTVESQEFPEMRDGWAPEPRTVHIKGESVIDSVNDLIKPLLTRPVRQCEPPTGNDVGRASGAPGPHPPGAESLRAQAACAGRFQAQGERAGPAGTFKSLDEACASVRQLHQQKSDAESAARFETANKVKPGKEIRELLLEKMAFHRKALTALEEAYADRFADPTEQSER